jgi:hypothetical protein
MIVKVDTKKNRLFLKFSGSVSKKELDKVYTDVRFAVADLLPGFSVINDLTECNLCHINAVATYKKISNYLVRNGVKDVVRIINKESVVLRQFLNFAARFAEYIPIYVSTLEEAEEQLDKTDRRNRLRFHFAGRLHVEYFSNSARGEGYIIDISTIGCKIASPTFPPAVDAIIDIVISFNALETSQKTFNSKASVVRTDDGGFAVEYKDIINEKKDELWQVLLQEFEYDLEVFPAEIVQQK